MPIASDSATLNVIRSIGWNGLEAIGTLLAFFAAIWAINESNKQSQKALERIEKQLEIEQEPYVVVKNPITIGDNFLYLNVKNVGRGPALSVVGGTRPKDINQSFFSDTEPHAEYLSAGEGREEAWKVDLSRLGEMQAVEEGESKYPIFYLFYKSQLGRWYQTLVKVRELGESNYKVMENNRENF